MAGIGNYVYPEGTKGRLAGVLGATVVNSGIDFVTGFLQLPKLLGHLGEGTECFWDHPSWQTCPLRTRPHKTIR